MILFFSTKITDVRNSKYHRNHWVPDYNRFLIFKYCLASYAPIKHLFKKTIFYLELGSEFEDRKKELQEYIFDLYPDCELYWYRNDTAMTWRKTCDKHFQDDDIIWYNGNDDHIFIDYNLDVVEDIINTLKEDSDPLSVLYYSHWPEQCRISKHLNGELNPTKNLIKYTWSNTDAIHILKGKRLKLMWQGTCLEPATDGSEKPFLDVLYRTDHLIWFDNKRSEFTANFYAPTREIVRHYDGYSHLVGHSDFYTNTVPPLVIPDGFFEKNIKIRIGYTECKTGYVTFNSSCDLFTATPTGVDYRWLESDIPLFWRDRITEIDYAPGYDLIQDSLNRDKAFIKNTRLPMTAWGVHFDEHYGHPVEIFEKHLKAPK